MTTDLKQLMHDAAYDAPPAHQLAAGARTAARRIQRRRTVAATAAAGATLGAVSLLYRGGLPARPGVSQGGTPPASVVGGQPPRTSADPAAPVFSAEPGTPTAAPGQTASAALPVSTLGDCGARAQFVQRDVPPAQLPIRLLSADPAYRDGLEWVHSTDTTFDCLPARAALVLTDTDADGVIRRAVTVWGPQRTPVDWGSWASVYRVEPTTVRGVAARFATYGTNAEYANNFRIAWSEPGAGSWEVAGSGVTRAQLESIVEDLRIGDQQVSFSTIPAAFTAEAASPARVAADTAQRDWFIRYKTANDDLLLGASDSPRMLAERVAQAPPRTWRLTRVRGHRALALVKEARVVNLSWEERPGLWISLDSASGGTDAEALASFADSLESVASDDPRIAGKLRGYQEQSTTPSAETSGPAPSEPRT